MMALGVVGWVVVVAGLVCAIVLAAAIWFYPRDNSF